MPQITNNIAFVEIGSQHIQGNSFYRKISYANYVLSAFGRDIFEFRFIQNNAKIITETLESLLVNCSMILISGSFGIQNGDIIARIIAKIFNTPLELNREAEKIYFAYLVENNIEYSKNYAQMFILPQNSLVIPLKNNKFAFHYANFICFDETHQSMERVLDYLKNNICSMHKLFSMQTIASIPLEIFMKDVNIIALENNVALRVICESENCYRISAKHENLVLLEDFMRKLADLLNTLKVLHQNNLLDKIHRNL